MRFIGSMRDISCQEYGGGEGERGDDGCDKLFGRRESIYRRGPMITVLKLTDKIHFRLIKSVKGALAINTENIEHFN